MPLEFGVSAPPSLPQKSDIVGRCARIQTPKMSIRRNSNERYLVIGGAGFLGSYIVQALVDRGEVVAVFGGAKPIDNEVIGGVSYFPGDITNGKELRNCLEKVSLQLCRLPHVFILLILVSVDLANGCLPYCLSERQE